ncbi:MAG TPA: class I adenylate-forming enzyme family protein [Candidatus Binatia bacterium]|nr:class I adenylate-forming enzyme family protein [Candidatus Binatia bacterium]
MRCGSIVPDPVSVQQFNNDRLFPLLDYAARQWPTDVALVRGTHTFTFKQLKIAAEQLASKLAESDIQSGCKVGLMCPNGPEYIIGSFALFLVDAVVVPIFPGLTEREIATLATDLSLDAHCYIPQFGNQLPPRRRKNELNLEAVSLVLEIGRSSQQDATASDRHRLAQLGAPLIRFTSGTTSKSKGVILPQMSLLESTQRFAEVYSIQRGDCILNLLSMPHIFCQVTAGILKGAKLVVADANRIDAIARIIRDHNVTHIEAAPTFYTMLLAADSLRAEHLSQVKYITSCGAPLPDRIAEAFRDRFGREIVQRYGLTETGPVLINTNEDKSKRGSVGIAAPGCDIRLKDEDDDPSATVGEIQIRCAGLFYGYYVPWTPREHVLDDGWFCTGDVARKDVDGYYWMAGRLYPNIWVSSKN